MYLDLDGDGPRYAQLIRSLKGAILDGRFAAGARLPASRSLARELDISRNTVLAAYEQLQAEGFLVGRVGSGSYVASVGNPRLTVQAKVETFGFKRVITGPTVEAVRLKLQDLLERGAVLVQDAELADGVWTAVCEKT